MNVVKKLLIAHGDQKIRRRLVLLLADAGYDLRPCGSIDAAVEAARSEWFDLALIDYELSGARNFSFVEELKKIQPTVPVILFVQKFELPLIVKGIRVGVTDVVSQNDLGSAARRVATILNPDVPAPADAEGITTAELAEVEVALDRISNGDEAGADSTDYSAENLSAELLRGAKERAVLENQNARLEAEKAALEAELKILLSQISDAGRLEGESAELRSQLEIAAAAQMAIDAKARQLAETRAEIARERTALEEERQRASTGLSSGDLAKEREEMHSWRAQLHQEQDRLAEETSRLQHESTKLAQERRRWHEDLDLLREQEKNLHDYEARLRQVQAQLEADRVLWFSARGTSSHSPFTDDSALKEAWQKVQRATELLEAERMNFRDEKLIFAEYEAQVRQREAKARELVAKLEERNALPPPSGEHGSGLAAVKSLTRAPLEVAKSVFGK